MNTVLYPIAAAIALIALVYKLIDLKHGRSPAKLALIFNFTTLTLIYTLSTPVVWVAVSAGVGIPNFSGLASQSAVMVMVASQQLLLLHWANERKAAWRKAVPRLIALVAVVATMVILFAAATAMSERSTDFALSRAQYYPAYLSVYLLAYIAGQIDVMRLCLRHRKVASTTWLRRGLFLAALGFGLGLVYATGRVAGIVVAQFGGTGYAWEPIVVAAVSIGTLCNVLGWTAPSWGPYVSAGWAWFRRPRAYRELMPLHRAITDVVPPMIPIPLEQGAPLKTRLYRTLIEIRDGQRTLQPWMPSTLADAARKHGSAAHLTDHDLAAVIEAAQLRVALHAKAADEPTQFGGGSPATVAAPAGPAAEIAHLRRVARAFRLSPIVDAAVAEAAGSRVDMPAGEPA